MRHIPIDIGTLHFIGIGGIGMSGIAEVLHTLGYKVQGSDTSDNANVKRLRGLGIRCHIGHRAENIADTAVVVVSSAITADNPEITAARAQLIPIVKRAEMLGELMRLKWSIAIGGTHGKTTTTSLIAALLDGAGLDPTVINGGIINAYGTNARLGQGDWLVAEADESDGSFLRLPASVAVVTNIDPEHLDHYGNFDALRRAFESFIQNLPFYGFAALCIDHPEVQAMIPRVSDRRLITYGFASQADVRAANLSAAVDGSRFTAHIAARHGKSGTVIDDIYLPIVGVHNVQNALAALAVGHHIGIDGSLMRRALAKFSGVKRRFTKTGEVGGITIIDDYGHHPVEIRAVLAAARQAGHGQVIAVMQPHRYSRLASLFEEFCTCFNAADHVLVADVYGAGEPALAGIDADHLVMGLRQRGHRGVHRLLEPGQLAGMVQNLAKAGDFVVCLGAGTITHWAHSLPGELAVLMGEKAS
jgi:UDP-N-acetylmuramate--alanine ligase